MGRALEGALALARAQGRVLDPDDATTAVLTLLVLCSEVDAAVVAALAGEGGYYGVLGRLADEGIVPTMQARDGRTLYSLQPNTAKLAYLLLCARLGTSGQAALYEHGRSLPVPGKNLATAVNRVADELGTPAPTDPRDYLSRLLAMPEAHCAEAYRRITAAVGVRDD